MVRPGGDIGMKKRIFVIVTLGLLLTGCKSNMINQSALETRNKTSISRFIVVEDNGMSDGFKVVYDRETGVMYTLSCGSYNRGNFTMLVNADGTPLIWNDRR